MSTVSGPISNRAASPRGLSSQGFTLIEMLIAVTIFSIIMTILYGVVTRTLVGSNRAEERADLYASGREIVLRMADEIEGALPPQPGSDVAFIGGAEEGSRQQDRLSFFMTMRQMHSAAQRLGGRALVEYSVVPQEGKPGVFALVRHQEFYVPAGLGQEEDSFAAEEDGGIEGGDDLVSEGGGGMQAVPTALALSDRVAGLRFQYMNPANGETVDEWDSTQAPTSNESPQGLPGEVRIMLYLYDGNGATHEFATTVDLPLANFAPTPGAQ